MVSVRITAQIGKIFKFLVLQYRDQVCNDIAISSQLVRLNHQLNQIGSVVVSVWPPWQDPTLTHLRHSSPKVLDLRLYSAYQDRSSCLSHMSSAADSLAFSSTDEL